MTVHQPISVRERVARFVVAERAVLFAATGKLWSVCSGGVTILLIAKYFSPEQQGFYYTFNSLLAFQVFAELGLGTVLTYYASHEWAQLSLDKVGGVKGDIDALSRLQSLARFSFKWYGVSSFCLVLVLVVGGDIFFASKGGDENWRGPWIVLSLVTGLALLAVPFWAILEGCNEVSNVYAYRLAQVIVSGLAAWTAIALGAGLWTASISGCAGLLTMIILASRRYTRFFLTLFAARSRRDGLRWRSDILPMQWRVALSWVSGYLTFSLFTPVLFHYRGPVEAGQMGMTWVIASALMAIASGWVAPKAPQFGILIAQRRYVELDQLFWRVTASVCAVVILGAVGIWFAVVMLNYLHHPLALRMLAPLPTACMLGAIAFVSASLPMATYLRAHKREPLLGISVVCGLVTGLAIVVLARYYSAEAVAIGYFLLMATFTPFVALIWLRRRTEWHAPARSVATA